MITFRDIKLSDIKMIGDWIKINTYTKNGILIIRYQEFLH